MRRSSSPHSLQWAAGISDAVASFAKLLAWGADLTVSSVKTPRPFRGGGVASGSLLGFDGAIVKHSSKKVLKCFESDVIAFEKTVFGLSVRSNMNDDCASASEV